jgi:hypothetical protein
MPWKRKLYRGLFALVGTVLFVSAGFCVILAWNPSKASAEQYAVYSAYIEDGLTGESHSLGDRRGTVIIAADSALVDEPNTFQRWRYMAGSLLNLQSRPFHPRSSQVCRLFLRNLKSHRLDRRFSISADYVLLVAAALSDPKIQERYPRSYGSLTFSSVAFTPDLTEALFYTEHACGLCGGGGYVLMRKVDGKWKVVYQYSTWVS